MMLARVKDVLARGHSAIMFHLFLCHFSDEAIVEILKEASTWLKDGGAILVKEPRLEGDCFQMNKQPTAW